MTIVRLLVLILAIALLCMPAKAGAQAQDSSVVLAAAQRDVAVLTADSLHGRAYASGGARKAAAYLRRQFESIGLEAPEGGYFQSFSFTASLVRGTPSLVIDGDSADLGQDFVPHGISGAGRIARPAGLMRVGAGLVIPSRDRSDYRGLDVQDAVVVIDEQVPRSVRSDTSVSREEWSIITRVQSAVDRGARAVLVLTDDLVYAPYPFHVTIPVLLVDRSAWHEGGAEVSLAVDLARNQRISAQNVIGLVPGTAHPDSVLMVTAHYDHVGRLGPTVYFPGANDNASGTAMLLALARHFERHPLSYTVAFVAFSGEELGLLGSTYFAEHPVVDLSRIRFLVNFDMVASGTRGIMAVGGTDYPGAYGRLVALNDSLAIGPMARRPNARNSDHYPLTARGVRGFFLYTRDGTQPYHHVNDVSDTLDWQEWLDVYTLALHFLRSTAGS